MTTPVSERFWAKVNKDGPTLRPELGPCWEWTAYRQRGRYGEFGIGDAVYHAHRVSWELTNGPIPHGTGKHGTCVLHRCDNKACVRPDHLFLGTQRDNIRDCVAKGRALKGDRRGERNPAAKLTAGDVMAIRSLLAEGKLSLPKIGALFGVSKYPIARIARNVGWTHIA